jgi:hypothetical protein
MKAIKVSVVNGAVLCEEVEIIKGANTKTINAAVGGRFELFGVEYKNKECAAYVNEEWREDPNKVSFWCGGVEVGGTVIVFGPLSRSGYDTSCPLSVEELTALCRVD